MTDDREIQIPPTTELYDEGSQETAEQPEPALVVYLGSDAQSQLDSLAEAVSRPREAAAGALVRKRLSAPEVGELLETSSSKAAPETDEPAPIPTTSEIYLSSFQEQSKEELRPELDEADQQRIRELAARHRLPPGRVAELLLDSGLQSSSLDEADFLEETEPSRGFFGSIRKRLGF